MDDDRSTHLTTDEAGAAMVITSSNEWKAILSYLTRCLAASQNDLEILSVDKTPGALAAAQGECKQIRLFLTLRERAEKVIIGSRNRK